RLAITTGRVRGGEKDGLLWAALTRRGLFARRAFRCFHRSPRVIDTRRGTLAMHRSALGRLALKFSIEHAAGEDGPRSVASDSQRQHPNQSRQQEGSKHAHGKFPVRSRQHNGTGKGSEQLASRTASRLV